MTPADTAFGAKAAEVADATLLPPGYTSDLTPIPRMGLHGGDSTSHEFHGAAFTATMIYGYYDAKMIFTEPIMAKAFAESKPNFSAAMRTPARYPKAGRYDIWFDARRGGKGVSCQFEFVR